MAWRRDGHLKEDTMSHDKINSAARRRKAQTGESYISARYGAIEAQRTGRPSSSSNPDASVTYEFHEIADILSPVTEMARQLVELPAIVGMVASPAQ